MADIVCYCVFISQPDNGSNVTAGLIDQSTLISTSPTSMAGLSMGQASLTTQILGPGEVIRASGKFSKPTKIPGKNYSKDEVVIRNADSGKGKVSMNIF